MMQTSFQIVDSKKIKATMTVTMTLGDWEIFRDQIKDKWPGSDLAYNITDMLLQATKTYYPKETAE